jgi:hypothetical protein
MIFELLRTYKVDVLRYLPKFLKSDGSFKATEDALSEEHEKQRLLIIDICKQLFVESATWGLSDWERVYGIKTNKHLTIKQRRQNLLVKIQGTKTITVKQLETIINQVVPVCGAHVLENTNPNEFKVALDVAAYVEKVRELVDKYKPAHLTYVIAELYQANNYIYIGGVVNVFDKQIVKYAKSDPVIRASVHHKIGMVLINVDKMKIYGGNQ